MTAPQPPLDDAQAQLRRSEARIHLLTDAGSILSRFLEPAAFLKDLAARLVPTLGDACFIDLIDRKGDIARVAWAHVRKDRRTEFDALWPRVPPTSFERHPSALMISKGDPIFEPKVDSAWMKRSANRARACGSAQPCAGRSRKTTANLSKPTEKR